MYAEVELFIATFFFLPTPPCPQRPLRVRPPAANVVLELEGDVGGFELISVERVPGQRGGGDAFFCLYIVRYE